MNTQTWTEHRAAPAPAPTWTEHNAAKAALEARERTNVALDILNKARALFPNVGFTGYEILHIGTGWSVFLEDRWLRDDYEFLLPLAQDVDLEALVTDEVNTVLA